MPIYLEKVLKILAAVLLTLAIILVVFVIANALGGKITIHQSWRQWLAFISRVDLVSVIVLSVFAQHLVAHYWPYE